MIDGLYVLALLSCANPMDSTGGYDEPPTLEALDRECSFPAESDVMARSTRGREVFPEDGTRFRAIDLTYAQPSLAFLDAGTDGFHLPL